MAQILHKITFKNQELKSLGEIKALLLTNINGNVDMLKLYLDDNFDEKRKVLIEWVQSKHDYADFANNIQITGIDSKYNIDYRSSKIQFIGYDDSNLFEDSLGKYVAFGFKSIVLKTNIDKSLEFQSEKKCTVLFDKYANHLIYSSLANLQEITIGKIKFNLHISGGVRDELENCFSSLNGQHQDLDLDELLKYIEVICSALSFYQGDQIFYEQVDLYDSKTHTRKYRRAPKKELILKKDLGRINVNDNLFEFLSKLSIGLIDNSKLLLHITELFNLGIKSEGTTQFILYFSVVEKIRKFYYGKDDKEKFSFTNEDEINGIIENKLKEIATHIVEEELDQFMSIIKDKLVNIKYLPQKDQFTPLFQKLKINPEHFNINWKNLVSLRGKIIHGEYFDPDDKKMLDINHKMFLFTGIIIYNFMTTDN